MENLNLIRCDIGLIEAVTLAAVAEHLPKLRVLRTSYQKNEYERSDAGAPLREPYGGYAGFHVLLYAPWESLEKFEFHIFELSQDVAREWKVKYPENGHYTGQTLWWKYLRAGYLCMYGH